MDSVINNYIFFYYLLFTCNTLVTQDGNLPLFLALENGNHGVCRELLKELSKEQINMHRPATGETGIHIGMRKKDIDMLRLMVDNGGDVDQQNVNIMLFYINHSINKIVILLFVVFSCVDTQINRKKVKLLFIWPPLWVMNSLSNSCTW